MTVMRQDVRALYKSLSALGQHIQASPMADVITWTAGASMIEVAFSLKAPWTKLRELLAVEDR
jgi:hypothetical protein